MSAQLFSEHIMLGAVLRSSNRLHCRQTAIQAWMEECAGGASSPIKRNDGGSAACRAILCSRSSCTEEHSYLTMVCSAMAGPEVKNSRDAVKDARAVPDRCRMCLAHSPVFQTVGSAAGKGMVGPRTRDEEGESKIGTRLEGCDCLTRVSALHHSQPRLERLCILRNRCTAKLHVKACMCIGYAPTNLQHPWPPLQALSGD